MLDDAELMRTVGKRIKAAREAAGMSQQQLADLIDMTRASIANLEAGHQRLNIGRLVTVLAALGIGVDALIEPGDLPDLHLPHNVVIKKAFKVSCITCGTVVATADATGEARQIRDEHIAAAEVAS